MQAKRFQATSLAEAYALVRDKFGDEAVILSTRNAVGPGRFGLGRREYVEVVAGLPDASDQLDGTAPLAEDVAAELRAELVPDGLRLRIPCTSTTDMAGV